MSHPAKSGGTARPHGDSVYCQFAMLRDQHRRQILDADTRSSGDDHDVRVSLKGFEDGIFFVVNQAREIDDASVALDKRHEHRPVSINDMKTTRMRARGQQLVTRHGEPYTRLADHAHLALARGAKDAQVLWTQHASRFKQCRSANDVLTAFAEILSR